MSTERTLQQSTDALRRAQERSLQRTRPPTQVPGYEIEQFLGAGAYGEVWVATDRNTGRRVAIKFYTHRGGLDWSLLSREVEKLAFLFADRYVVQLIDVGWDADPPFYIMEYLGQGSLADRLNVGPMPAAAAVEMFREVAVGLVHAHGKGVLHCDLKPANILLDQDGKPRLADFGQSRLSHEQTPALGTLFYMAPEQADLKAVPDARWDVYALGALLYCMLTGEPPFRELQAITAMQDSGGLEEMLARYRDLIRTSPPPRLHRRVAGVDRELADMIDRCLAADPRKRFPNAQAVIDALAARGARRARRPMLVLGALGPAVLLIVMSLFGWTAVDLAVGESTGALTERALQSNRFAAQFVAETVAREVDLRWKLLESIASDPDFRSLLIEATGQPLGSPDRDRLQRRLEELDLEHAEIESSSWVVMDAGGTQLARSPFDTKTVGQNYAFRDYFHGQGRNLRKGTRAPPFERVAHLSTVFKSEASGERKVAFSVPVWSAKPGAPERRIVGVLSVTVALGQFAELRPEDGNRNNQRAVLVDAKGDWNQRKGAILEHPHLAELLKQSATLPDLYLDAGRIEMLERLRALKRDDSAAPDEPARVGELAAWQDYRDPVERDGGGRWLAAIEPVVVSERPASIRDTGWAVIVQEPYQAAVAPVLGLGESLMRLGMLALGVVLAVITGLWGFVMIVLDESPASRWVARLRRRAGLAQPSSAINTAGASSPRPSAVREAALAPTASYRTDPADAAAPE